MRSNENLRSKVRSLTHELDCRPGPLWMKERADLWRQDRRREGAAGDGHGAISSRRSEAAHQALGGSWTMRRDWTPVLRRPRPRAHTELRHLRPPNVQPVRLPRDCVRLAPAPPDLLRAGPRQARLRALARLDGPSVRPWACPMLPRSSGRCEPPFYQN